MRTTKRFPSHIFKEVSYCDLPTPPSPFRDALMTESNDYTGDLIADLDEFDGVRA
jgi:hypothetical protein